MFRLLLSFLLISVNAIFAGRFPETIIKVGILQKVSSVNISCEGKYRIYDLLTGNQEEILTRDIFLVKPVKRGLIFSTKKFSAQIRLVPLSDTNLVKVNGKRYRDSILINRTSRGELNVINELGIEHYLYGILPAEVDPSWPVEVLKAQAIVSRTYALKNLGRHNNDGYDFCNTVHCQVYRGVEGENKQSNTAIDSTRGKVITYKERIISAVYHACCAGFTEEAKNVWDWPDAPEYLSSHKCGYCSDSPHYTWKRKVKEGYIRDRLIKAGYNVGKIKSIKCSGKNISGRIKLISIETDKDNLTLQAAKFRTLIDPWVIKSTKIESIVREGNSFIFSGYGWGHGVGMCQWGAKVMAEKGFTHQEIIKYYYPNSEIETWEE